MKSAYSLTLGCLLFLFFIAGCKREETLGQKYDLNGAVYLINSNTPVPNALVLFLRYNNDSWVTTYTEVGRDTTDANGNYTIPKSSEAQLVRAYGPAAIYDMPSVEHYIDWEPNEFLDLYLIPPAWLKVRAIDIEPSNPEVIFVHADTLGGTGGAVNISDGYQTWKTEGNSDQFIKYLLYDEDMNFEILHWVIDPPTPFDTTEITIEY